MATTDAPNIKRLQVRRFKPEESPKEHYLNAEKGLWSWLSTVDHKRIGLMYFGSIAFFFLFGGILALVLRTELLTPTQSFIEAETYNQIFTLHGAIMIFFFLVPSVPSALGNFILPLQLGAKDVAFPRLNLFSYHLFFFGALFFVLTLMMGVVDTGWTFYAPYSVETSTAVTTAVSGAFILGFGSIFTGLNFLVTVHTLR